MLSLKEIVSKKQAGSLVSKNERKALLQDLVNATGLPLWRILIKTKGMQTPEDLRFILSSMKNVPKAKDGAHAFNTVLFQPKNEDLLPL